eukprot:TRINITY_DN2280_c0_g1_i1.p1 TRINITY_DN2280_c0_g1~~TRINITY_DN2280_c0_g1_i1.p1  ORF type:complete len:404 (+),score=101.25 TRINITY_DN2280_c0_g1_i1:91-1302(+)
MARSIFFLLFLSLIFLANFASSARSDISPSNLNGRAINGTSVVITWNAPAMNCSDIGQDFVSWLVTIPDVSDYSCTSINSNITDLSCSWPSYSSYDFGLVLICSLDESERVNGHLSTIAIAADSPASVELSLDFSATSPQFIATITNGTASCENAGGSFKGFNTILWIESGSTTPTAEVCDVVDGNHLRCPAPFDSTFFLSVSISCTNSTLSSGTKDSNTITTLPKVSDYQLADHSRVMTLQGGGKISYTRSNINELFGLFTTTPTTQNARNDRNCITFFVGRIFKDGPSFDSSTVLNSTTFVFDYSSAGWTDEDASRIKIYRTDAGNQPIEMTCSTSTPQTVDTKKKTVSFTACKLGNFAIQLNEATNTKAVTSLSASMHQNSISFVLSCISLTFVLSKRWR